MAEKRKSTTDSGKAPSPASTDTPADDDLGPSDLGPPADATKTADGYIYPDSGSFVVETHKGTKTEPTPKQHPPGKRRG